FLLNDLWHRILLIRDSLERLERLREQVLPVSQQRLQERLQKLAGQVGLEASRLAQEAAVMAEHSDVSEEVVRFKSHLARFPKLLEDEQEAGKKLDFLLQEMNREL